MRNGSAAHGRKLKKREDRLKKEDQLNEEIIVNDEYCVAEYDYFTTNELEVCFRKGEKSHD